MKGNRMSTEPRFGEPTTSELTAWLLRPESYSHWPACVEHIETHISHVFVAGDLVYKLKKPVRYDFLDFTTLAAREEACREELRLNRRLAPHAYLAVMPIHKGRGGGFRLGDENEHLHDELIVDWLVKMRRLPTDQSLEALAQRGELRPADIDRLAETLVGFYGSLNRLPISPDEYRARTLAHVRGNRQALLETSELFGTKTVEGESPAAVIRRVSGFQQTLLQLSPELFDERVRTGKVVDGHGDLRPEHICLADPVAIFDCIEFSADFRRIDVADELAFLAAECDFLGVRWVGPQLFERYQERTGDTFPAVLLDFYKCYRACVRAKVAALRAKQLEGQTQPKALAEACRHLDLADGYAAPRLAPLEIVVGGLAGTGKSTLAAALADSFGAELLRTDTIREELFGKSTPGTAVDAGMYRPEARQQVYVELFARGAAWHRQGVSVVLDGTFSTVDSVLETSAIAEHPRAVFLAVECVCPPEVARGRIERRLAAGRDASEARPELHEIQRSRWESWPEALPQIQVDTRQPLAQQASCVTAALRASFATIQAASST
jgi:aminoglycoside phosphotransferase family enzyme/predicted kinase